MSLKDIDTEILDDTDIVAMKSYIKRDLEFIHRSPISTPNISFITKSIDGKFLITFNINGKREILNEKGKFARLPMETVEEAWFNLYRVVAEEAGWINGEVLRMEGIGDTGLDSG